MTKVRQKPVYPWVLIGWLPGGAIIVVWCAYAYMFYEWFVCLLLIEWSRTVLSLTWTKDGGKLHVKEETRLLTECNKL